MSAKDTPMLHAEHQTNEGRRWEESGKIPEGDESTAIFSQAALLSYAANVGEQAAADCRESGWRGDWLVLLQALCALTARHAESGNPTPTFTAERLREEVAQIVGTPESQWWLGDTDSARKKFTNAWKTLATDLPRLSENLRGRAIKGGVPGMITLAEPERLGTTNAMGYGLAVLALDLPMTRAKPATSPSAQPVSLAGTPVLEIDYQEEMEVYPIPGVRRPLRISLPGWRGMLVVAPLFGALVVGGFLAWLLFTLWMSNEPPRVLFQWTILTSIIGAMLAWFCHPFHTLLNNRIVRAPTVLEAMLPLGHVLVLRREADDRVLRMVRFTANCPICEGEVTIEKGRRQHRGRLVGECGRNPVEHVFSFDFVTAKGRQL